jgi:hypothetical protein
MTRSSKDKTMYDFLTFIKPLDPTSEDDAQVLDEHTSMRVQEALCGVAAAPCDAPQIRQSLIDDLSAAPAACLPGALAELHAIAAYLFGGSDPAWTSFRGQGAERQLMAEELAALARNPYRYVAGGLCDHVESTVEHLEAVFELVLAMLLAWPDGGCPICRYFDCELPDFDDEVPAEDCTAPTSV